MPELRLKPEYIPRPNRLFSLCLQRITQAAEPYGVSPMSDTLFARWIFSLGGVYDPKTHLGLECSQVMPNHAILEWDPGQQSELSACVERINEKFVPRLAKTHITSQSGNPHILRFDLALDLTLFPQTMINEYSAWLGQVRLIDPNLLERWQIQSGSRSQTSEQIMRHVSETFDYLRYMSFGTNDRHEPLGYQIHRAIEIIRADHSLNPERKEEFCGILYEVGSDFFENRLSERDLKAMKWLKSSFLANINDIYSIHSFSHIVQIDMAIGDLLNGTQRAEERAVLLKEGVHAANALLENMPLPGSIDNRCPEANALYDLVKQYLDITAIEESRFLASEFRKVMDALLELNGRLPPNEQLEKQRQHHSANTRER